jgi:hypothetical protein
MSSDVCVTTGFDHGLDRQVRSEFVREAVARMHTAPRFLSQEAWDDLASYEGPVVSGDPEGNVPDNLEDDDI